MKNNAPDYILPTYRRSPLAFVSGEGAWLTASDGTRYLDFSSGIAVNTLGHAAPELVAALTAQAQKLWHVSNLYQIPEQQELAALLCAHSFADLVFFCNSGAEAVEGTIKTMRKYHAAMGAPKRKTIIGFAGAFHGRTLTALAAAGNADKLADFGPVPQGFVQCAQFDIAALEKLIDDTTAGILLEPVQGEGGVRDVGTAFLRAVRALCDKHDILLALDEVQCGIGRTGKLFAHEWAGITPDIMAIAKGIGGGFPLGAFLTTRKIGAVMQAGTHGSTFGGNPLACAVGLAVMQIVLGDGFLQNVQNQALYLRQKLAELVDSDPDIFTNISGRGLMIGLHCQPPNADVVAALRDVQLLTVRAANNVLRLLPPLNVTHTDIDTAIDKLKTACVSLQTPNKGVRHE
ncbi:MAG: aspartate aminotransferase family protein [Parvibaculales bacterium]